MSQLNIFPGLASILGKERACLSEISGAMKQESLELLVTVFVAARKSLPARKFLLFPPSNDLYFNSAPEVALLGLGK